MTINVPQFSYISPQKEYFQSIKPVSKDDIDGLDFFGFKLENPFQNENNISNLLDSKNIVDPDGFLTEKLKSVLNVNDRARIINDFARTGQFTAKMADSAKFRDIGIQTALQREQFDREMRMQAQNARINMDIAKLNARTSSDNNAMQFLSSLMSKRY